MANQNPLRILSLDGGGVRGISSLYILREVMAQIRRQKRIGNEPEQSPLLRPCDVFDLICGTSTGGLIALMLGRLEMVHLRMYVLIRKTVDEAIKKYLLLSETIFGAMSKDRTVKFDHDALEDILKKAVTESPLNLQADAPLADQNTCKTFVVAIRIRAGGAAVRMRTYNTTTADAFSAQIWEAARATSAAPTIFEPITINGVTYGDGGAGWNNPTVEAIAEAHKIWPNRPIGCLLSIGTGLEKAIQLSQDHEISPECHAQLLRMLAPKEFFQSEVAKYYVASLTSCEKVHRDVSSQFPDRIAPYKNYFRLNVPQGISEIGLEEWKKIGDIIALTESYMEHGEMEEWKITIAKLLLNPQVAGLTPFPQCSLYRV
jgi:predicted acylesterase/phospholipase RssA